MKKIAFFDIDGTLIDMEKKKITKVMEDTLIQLKQKGILLCIATGRHPKSVPQFQNIEFDAFLTFNASYCFTKENIIYKNPIPTKDVLKIIENASSIHRPVSLATMDRMGANGKDQDLVDYYAISSQEVVVANDFNALAQEEVYQIMMGCRESEYEAIMKDAKGAKLTAWWDRAADIIPANGGKGSGVEKILAYFKIKKEDAIAFGDGANDIEMLQAVGTGVAMGNASEDVKANADDVCGPVSNEGIHEYCLQHCLLNE